MTQMKPQSWLLNSLWTISSMYVLTNWFYTNMKTKKNFISTKNPNKTKW